MTQAGHGRHVEGPRQDGRVIRPAPGIRDERGKPLPIELRDQRRAQLVGHEHQRTTLDVAEQIDWIAIRAQVHAEPADDVGDVSLPLAEVRVISLIEERRDLIQRAAQRRFGVEAFHPDDRRGAIDQHRIVEHQQLRVEQVGVLGAGGRGDPFLQVLELLA